MLTWNLLRYTLRKGKLIPRFLDVENLMLQELAQKLTLPFETGTGQSQEELAEVAHPIINAHSSPLVAKGLNKLLLDRCKFQESDDAVESQRMQIFEQAAIHLQRPDMDNLTHFRQAVGQGMEQDPDLLAAQMYADLPLRQPLLSFRTLSPLALLHRYNMAQAQGPLIRANEMTIQFTEPAVGKRRQFFRYLKFFRLLARISSLGRGGYRMRMDGPLSLFENTRKYGIKFARFLPAVCTLAKWSLHARVMTPEGKMTFDLELDQDSGLKSHYSQTSTFVPEEFERFEADFREKSETWKILKAIPLLDLGRQEQAVPDFSFRHPSGTTVHVELFHRWHAAALRSRLLRLDTPGKHPSLALGVDRALAKQAETAALLENSAWFQERGFLFNAFPPVKRVVECLAGFLPAEQSAK